MSFNIFDSWQVKTPSTYNRNFIENCLKEAIKQLKKEMGDNSPDFYIDRDTKDVPGRPNIPTTIEGKIRACDVFVGDVTYVAYIETRQPQGKRTLVDKLFARNKWIKEGIYSTNVAEELGTANGALRGSERVVTIMNTAYGTPDQLNFDSRQAKYPLTYHYNESTSDEQRKVEKKKLIGGLKDRIRLIFETHHERQKEYFSPFVTWRTWETLFKRPFPFENTEYLTGIFNTIKESASTPKTIFRLCGLSGIGKTRLLFECFMNPQNSQPGILVNKILYVDVKEQDDKSVIKAVKELLQRNENKILIIDNCPKDLHISVVPLISSEKSDLTVITVSTDPEEKMEELESEQLTKQIVLDNKLCKQTVDQILSTNFKEFQEEELKLLADFSSGIAFIATLMAQNPNRGNYQPGTLTQTNVVKRLLGPLFDDDTSKAVIVACALFSKIGFSDELEYQVEKISLNEDLFAVKTDGLHADDRDEWKKNKFKEICKQLEERQLLEKKGRTYIFRPTPLAVRMAEDWWRDCTVKKFQRLIPALKEAGLVESFCEQFRYLKHVQNAQQIVKNLCDGFFSTAEVLNSLVGSRLFRSFVYVNPVACTTALENAFLNLPTAVLQRMKEGRRNLVWALEKLCFRPETFSDSTKVLAAFAVAENENLGNNATAQFLQLFHIQLPGTAANLEERWTIIQYCLENSEDYQSLAISAINSALSVGHFSRIGGAENQGDVVPLEDYQPKVSEVYQYWRNSVEVLEKHALSKNNFQERAISILTDKLYGLCENGAGNLIVPVVVKLIENGLYDRMEARTKIQFILNSGRVFDKQTVEQLSNMFESLTPTIFTDKFRILVSKPPYEEYINDETLNDRGKKLAKKIEALAKEFVGHQDKWDEWSSAFLTEHVAEGFNFGKSIALQVDEPDAGKLIDLLISKIKAVSPERRNISVLLGIIVNLNDQEFTRKVFVQLLGDEQLKSITFSIARSAQLPAKEIDLLLEETENGNLSTGAFGEFNYGWGLRHLSTEDITKIIQRLRKIDDIGKAVAFMILTTWLNNDAELFAQYNVQLREMILEDSDVILSNLNNSMDIFYYSKTLSKLLTERHDEELASHSVSVIIEHSNQLEYYSNKQNGFSKILNILQEKYFQVFWGNISKMYLNLDKYSIAAFHLKQILGSSHDHQRESEGLLFGGNPEKFNIIFDWCKQNKGRELYWVAELLPLFAKERDKQVQWHPFALKFIAEFGADTNVLDAISAKLGTYSWVGSVVPKLESDKALFEQLLNHKESVVREWAEIHLNDVDKRITVEKKRDEDGIW